MMARRDLAVGLGSVGPCPLVPDVELGAGRCPDAAAVAGTVVGEDAFHADTTNGEPGNCSAQDGSGGRPGLVVMDLGVGDAGVVIDDGVDVGVAVVFAAVFAAAGADRGGPVALSLRPAGEPPAAAVGNVAQLLHVLVQQ